MRSRRWKGSCQKLLIAKRKILWSEKIFFHKINWLLFAILCKTLCALSSKIENKKDKFLEPSYQKFLSIFVLSSIMSLKAVVRKLCISSLLYFCWPHIAYFIIFMTYGHGKDWISFKIFKFGRSDWRNTFGAFYSCYCPNLSKNLSKKSIKTLSKKSVKKSDKKFIK